MTLLKKPSSGIATAERAEHLLALRSLSSVQPRFSLEHSLAAVDALGGDEAGRFLDAMRMRTLVTRRLEPVRSHSAAVEECVAALADKVATLRRMHESLQANLDLLERIALDLGAVFIGGKGISAHATYADRAVRDFNDIDLFVRDRRTATALSRALRDELGYVYQRYELPWLKVDPADRLVYGQINLVAPTDREDLANVDIHFGDYSVRHCGRLGIAGTLKAGEPGLHMMAAEENVACIVNNAAGDYFVTAKDTNDLLMALSAPSFDTARLATLLRGSYLDGFFGAIVETLRASSTVTARQRERLDALPTRRSWEPAPRGDEPDWNRRCVGTTVHAFTTRRSEGVGPALKVAANAFSYYRKRLKLAVVPDAESGAGSAPVERIATNPWTCVRLVPVDLALELLGEGGDPALSGALPAVRSILAPDPGVERFETRMGAYYEVDGERFIATVDYRLPAELVRHAAVRAAKAPTR